MEYVGKMIAAEKNAKAAISVTKQLRDEKLPEIYVKIDKLEKLANQLNQKNAQLMIEVNLLKARLR